MLKIRIRGYLQTKFALDKK